jgi:hypothetical protein
LGPLVELASDLFWKSTASPAVNNGPDFPSSKRSTLHLLKELGFDYETKRSKAIMIERDDAVARSHEYLVLMKKFQNVNTTLCTKTNRVSVQYTEKKRSTEARQLKHESSSSGRMLLWFNITYRTRAAFCISIYQK